MFSSLSTFVRLGLHYDPVKAKQVFKLCSRRGLLFYSRLNSASRLSSLIPTPLSSDTNPRSRCKILEPLLVGIVSWAWQLS